MMRTVLLIAALLPLAACNGSKPAGGGTVTMQDMAVVDGTANDSMVDLDNAAQDGTPLSNAGLPGAVPMPTAVHHGATAPAADNAAAPDSGPTSNTGAQQ